MPPKTDLFKEFFVLNPCCSSSPTYFPAENLTEYKWPPDDTGEYYMLQEQVSEYLGVTSFKRKYPGKTEAKIINTYLLVFKDKVVLFFLKIL